MIFKGYCKKNLHLLGGSSWTQDTDTVEQGFLTFSSQIEFQSRIFLPPQNKQNGSYLINNQRYTPESV